MTTWPAPGCASRYWRAAPVTDETVAFTPPGLQSGAAAAVGAAMMPMVSPPRRQPALMPAARRRAGILLNFMIIFPSNV